MFHPNFISKADPQFLNKISNEISTDKNALNAFVNKFY